MTEDQVQQLGALGKEGGSNIWQHDGRVARA